MSTAVISTAVGIASCLITFLFSFVAFQNNKKKDNKDEGELKGVIVSDIGYIKSGIDDLKREQKETTATVANHTERIIRCEESVRQAHKRIDELKGE